MQAAASRAPPPQPALLQGVWSRWTKGRLCPGYGWSLTGDSIARWLPSSAGAVGTHPLSSWSESQLCSTGSSRDNSHSLKRGDRSSSLALL